jgi:hypothetical protein
MNCGVCGRHLSRFEMQKWQKDGRPICRDCRKDELKDKLKRAGAHSLSQIEIFKTKEDADLIDEIVKERKLKEQITPTEPTQPQKCPEGEEWSDDLHQCIKIVKPTPTKEQVTVPYQPAPEIPAQPVVPVGPVTIEQKVAALNDAITKIQKDVAFIFGVLGQRPPE